MSSFFHRDPPRDKEEFIEREREFDRKKREALIKELDEKTKDDEAGQQSEIKEADIVVPHRRGGLKERFEDYRLKRQLGSEEKELKRFKKKQDREEKRSKGVKDKERSVFGREMTAEERAAYVSYKSKKQQKKQESRKKLMNQLVGVGKELGGLSAVSSLSIGGDNVGGPSGKSILDITPSLETKKKDFESDFGRLLAGKKRKNKKGGFKPISLNAFD